MINVVVILMLFVKVNISVIFIVNVIFMINVTFILVLFVKVDINVIFIADVILFYDYRCFHVSVVW